MTSGSGSGTGTGTGSGSGSGSGSSSGSGACASLNVCDRYAAAAQVHALHPHNDQLVLMGLAYILIGGGMIQHFSKMYGITLPYTVMLLIFGILTGFWVTFDPAFTLQPGMKAFEHEWTGFVLQCNVTNTSFNTFMFFTPLFTESLTVYARRTQALNLRASRQCRWNKMSGSDHPTATSSAKGSREAGKGAGLGVNYGESEK